MESRQYSLFPMGVFTPVYNPTEGVSGTGGFLKQLHTHARVNGKDVASVSKVQHVKYLLEHKQVTQESVD